MKQIDTCGPLFIFLAQLNARDSLQTCFRQRWIYKSLWSHGYITASSRQNNHLAGCHALYKLLYFVTCSSSATSPSKAVICLAATSLAFWSMWSHVVVCCKTGSLPFGGWKGWEHYCNNKEEHYSIPSEREPFLASRSRELQKQRRTKNMKDE